MLERFGGMLALVLAPATMAAAERITVTGEIIDTWCYYSGVMGGPDAVVGSAHHTCAMWCSAGGIPIGLLAEDGTVYTVLKLGPQANATGGDTALTLASHTITADGMFYERDGVKYIVVEKVVEDMGITNPTHEEYDVVPSFAIPEPKE
ncbi:hypothetical protein BOO69_04220 [Sulfitobacter alexandrii]|uniref:Uncharacterized protein n=1 Tax=Sulfitobacter alexandrii TaxID=1917485 RepID=A0A1J0WEY9_9RHOB|nr:hypothetical protein [Sulfitobacter alexandrii]APE42718.1 hypothetical protein BOO69_04220 [Sulfitobacter alexandrii]